MYIRYFTTSNSPNNGFKANIKIGKFFLFFKFRNFEFCQINQSNLKISKVYTTRLQDIGIIETFAKTQYLCRFIWQKKYIAYFKTFKEKQLWILLKLLTLKRQYMFNSKPNFLGPSTLTLKCKKKLKVHRKNVKIAVNILAYGTCVYIACVHFRGLIEIANAVTLIILFQETEVTRYPSRNYNPLYCSRRLSRNEVYK